MSTGIVLQSNLATGLKRAPFSELADGPSAAEAVSDRIAAEHLVEHFANMTWKTLAPIMTLSLTLVFGVLACAQFLVLHS